MTESAASLNGSSRMIVVSGDSHVGPRLKEDLRQYCPQKYLQRYDEFIEANVNTMHAETVEPDAAEGRSSHANEVAFARRMINRQTAGHYDAHTRLREMDWDGIAAEVIFHGSQNTEVFPFGAFREWAVLKDRDFELARVGYRMYNRWAADFVGHTPERLIALAYVPMWDVDLAVEELEFCAELGLRGGINFASPRPGIAEYDDRSWEPLWSAAEAHKMNLVTHVGLPGNTVTGPQRRAMIRFEHGGWPARRGMVRMIFGGVFERHPGLKLILTELSRGWWSYTRRELDFIYASPSEQLYRQMPKKPSEYMDANVFIGASFMPPSEVHESIEGGYADHVIWGRDYPHGEGTYKFPESPDEESTTRHYLRWAFEGVDPAIATQILTDNGIFAYDLDREALVKVAAKIGPTVDDVTAPLDHVPADWANNLVDTQTGELAEGFVPLSARV